LDHLHSIAKREKLALQAVQRMRGLQDNLSRQSHDLDLLDVRFGTAGVDVVCQSFHLFNGRLLELLREESDGLERQNSLILEPSSNFPYPSVWLVDVHEQVFGSDDSCVGIQRVLARAKGPDKGRYEKTSPFSL